MADPIIELQELLNRASGPGKIGPDSPLETRLYGANGQPIGTQTNPLDVRVRELEAKLDELKQTIESGVQLKGSLPPSMMELAVNDWSELPDPTETPKGATAQLIGTFDVRQNTGAEWVEVVL